MINFKQLNTVLLSIFLSSSFGTTLCAQQATNTYQAPDNYRVGQVINGQVIQGQRVFQGQVIQNQPVQGQVFQGQVIQNRPVQGQVIQGQQFIQGQQIIQGPVIQGRPIRGNVVQPQNTQQQSQEQRKAAAANRAKIAEQATKIKALTDDNSRLSNVEETNNAMRTEYARLRKAYGEIGKELDDLKLGQAMKTAEPADTDAQDAKLNQLNAQYQEAVKQSGMMSGQIEALTEENTEIKNRLKGLSAASGEMTGFEAKLNTANNRITEIEQQNQLLATGNEKLQGELQATTAEHEKLNMRFSSLSQENEQLRGQYQTATETNTTLGEQVTDLSSQNQNYLASLNSRPTAEQPARTNFTAAPVDSGLAAERDQVLTLNTDLERKNALLMEQVSDLEAKIGSLDKTTAPQDSLLAVSVPALTGDPAPKFNIMKWLIPFLLLGLTIGLYVFLTEERGEEVATGFTSARAQSNQDGDKR